MRDPAFGVGALLGADRHHRAAGEAAEPADHRRIVGEGAVAGERREIGDQGGDVGLRLRPLGVARDLRLLPGRELRVGGAQEPLDLFGEPRHLLGDVDGLGLGKPAQLLDFPFELRDRLLEVEILMDRRQARASGWCSASRRDSRSASTCV